MNLVHFPPTRNSDSIPLDDAVRDLLERCSGNPETLAKISLLQSSALIEIGRGLGLDPGNMSSAHELIDAAQAAAKALAHENAALREEIQSLRVRLGILQQKFSEARTRIKQLTGR